ncbi:MAG: TldD/PmbA family protein [Desulfurococcales archaeon]|nr:TldD/PmbA family protein [Desulfurococcales archaeon]
MSLVDDIVKSVRDKVDEYLVSVRESKKFMVKLSNSEVTVVQSWIEYDVSLYITKNERIAVTSYTSRDPREAIAKTATLIDKLEKSPLYAKLPEPNGETLNYMDEDIIDIIENGDIENVIGGLELNNYQGLSGAIDLTAWKSTLKGSNGAEFNQMGTSFNGYVRIFRGEVSGQWAWTSTSYDLNMAKRAIQVAFELADECSKLPMEKVDPGRYRVLLSPMVVANLISHVVASASAGSVILGFSFLHGYKPGDSVASHVLTLRDAPRDRSMPDFSGHDDEGIITRDKAIIENGVFKGFLHNTKTARLMKEETTGNAGWILPRPFNVLVEPGSLKPSEMLEALGDGLYITNNWYTRFQNYLEGRFSSVTRDALFIVKNGRATACSSRVRISDLMPNLLYAIEDLGSEVWPIQWWEVETPSKVPFMLVSELGITRPEI